MNWHIVEDLIKKAQRDGQFDNLPGAGKPLPPDEFAHYPEDIRMVMRILKNSGHDEEAQFVKEEMSDLEHQMKKATQREKTELEQQYNQRLTQLNRMLSQKGIKTNSNVFKQYQSQLDNRLNWD
ncbi:DnaJ family domain-containing protein [Paenisporosarcina sp. FSL H8-0542]|uniref:DnaJ family domain-containing protein n=1 Tax=Paenisporosarcina sp. FSL H8-0542 TaxID=2921401 RepID=UPI00315ABABF